MVQFDNTFEVNSHLNVMKNLKQFMGDEEVLAEMKQMLPKLFEPYTARKFFEGLFESFKPSLN